MTPVGEVFFAIFCTLVFFVGLVAFCRYFCNNAPITCTRRSHRQLPARFAAALFSHAAKRLWRISGRRALTAALWPLCSTTSGPRCGTSVRRNGAACGGWASTQAPRCGAAAVRGEGARRRYIAARIITMLFSTRSKGSVELARYVLCVPVVYADKG